MSKWRRSELFASRHHLTYGSIDITVRNDEKGFAFWSHTFANLSIPQPMREVKTLSEAKREAVTRVADFARGVSICADNLLRETRGEP